MEYRKGDRVRHPTKDDWGLGEILESSNGESVRVFFVRGGEKKLSLQYVQPVKVTGNEATHPLLDNLKIDKSASEKYQSLPQSIQFFLKQFPGGFHGEKFKQHEREYKDKAHVLAHELLGKQAFGALLESEDYAGITKCALKLVNATNLVYRNEKMSLNDGLKSPVTHKAFSEALFSLLYGENGLEERFVGFAKVLEDIDAAKWTTATYFLFFIHSNKHMFVKPKIIKHASELCRFEVNYVSQLNWLTYKSVLDFSEYLFSAISELNPKDMIDVQSFMWCITPGN